VTERAKRIMKAYQRAKEKSVYYDEECVSAVIREIVSEFGYYHGDDDCGRWVVSSIDLIELANELEAL
jgi:hypothetical protein